MGQRVCFCEQQRASKLKQKKPTQKRLSDSMPWESFLRPLRGVISKSVNGMLAARGWIH